MGSLREPLLEWFYKGTIEFREGSVWALDGLQGFLKA